MRQAIIDWLDPRASDLWMGQDEVEAMEPFEVRSTGWIVKENESHITLASSMSSGKAMGVVCIPRGAIVATYPAEELFQEEV